MFDHLSLLLVVYVFLLIVCFVELLFVTSPSLAFIFLVQAEELRKALCAKNVPAEVYVGMRYWHPFTEEAIEQVPEQLYILL